MEHHDRMPDVEQDVWRGCAEEVYVRCPRGSAQDGQGKSFRQATTTTLCMLQKMLYLATVFLSYFAKNRPVSCHLSMLYASPILHEQLCITPKNAGDISTERDPESW